MDFTDSERLRKDISEGLREGESLDTEIREDILLEGLFNSAIACRKEFNWSKARIINKEQELIRLKKSWDRNQDFVPEFKFKSFKHDESKAIELLNQLEKNVDNIDRETVSDLGLKTLDRHDLRNLFRGIFEEYKLYIELHSNISNREAWRDTCTDIWHFDNSTAKHAIKQLNKRSFDDDRESKDIKANRVAEMWSDEIRRLGMEDYTVEVRNVSGCHNVPEDRTLVVAAGDNRERKYSYGEAQLLTVHEVFHAVRCYNGFNTTSGSGLPPILGVHTPFYDRAEEGGAVYREFETGKLRDWKEKDYYLRTVAAYHWKKGMKFQDSVEKLVELGASLKRAFALVARNREILRHQVYLGGYLDWKGLNNRDMMMVGKTNKKWSEKVWKEVQNGSFNEPEITAKQMFQSNSFAFDA